MKSTIVFATLVALSCAAVATPKAPKLSKDEAAARAATAKLLRDPASARFGQFTPAGDGGCLTVNAKNAYGAYPGDSQAVLVKSEGAWFAAAIEDMTHEKCVDFQKRTAKAPD